jgi:hypothetical protein
MRHLKLYCVIALAIGVAIGLLLPSYASAQTAPPTFNVPGIVYVSWVLPTHTECINPADVDPETCARLPLTDALALTSLELYVSDAPIADDYAGEPTAVLQPGLQTTQFNGAVPAGATLYFRLKARNQFARSRFTDEVSKVVPVPNVAPGVPVNVTVEIQVGVAPVAP